MTKSLSKAAHDIILESSEAELREAMGDKEFEECAARVKAIAQKALRSIEPLIQSTPSKDDPTRHELGTHFNLWTACGIVVVALVICYFTNTYPWIDGVLKF